MICWRLLIAIIELTKEIKRCRKVISLRKPGPVFVSVFSEENGMLKFVLVLPVLGAADIVSREVTVKVGDADAVTETLAGTATESSEYTGADNALVQGSLIDVDDAGNRSPVRTFEAALIDTLAPPQPGELGLRVTGEE